MATNFYKDDVVICYVGFTNERGGKIRPAAIIIDSEEIFIAYPKHITMQVRVNAFKSNITKL